MDNSHFGGRKNCQPYLRFGRVCGDSRLVVALEGHGLVDLILLDREISLSSRVTKSGQISGITGVV